MSIFDQLRKGIHTASAAETQAMAQALAEVLPEDACLALEGDLGSGKTTFTAGLARAWGIEDPVTSPTYNLLSLYEGVRLLAHIDAYRLSGASDMDALMLEELLRSPYCLCIEWPSRIEEWLPAGTLWLRFTTRPNAPHLIQLLDR